MSIALIGIIGVQIYWVQNAVEVKDAQFQNRVSSILREFSLELEKEQQTLRVARAMKPKVRSERRLTWTSDSSTIIHHEITDSSQKVTVKIDTIINAEGAKSSTMVYKNKDTGEEERVVISVGGKGKDEMTLTAQDIELSYAQVDQVMQEFFFEVTAGPTSLALEYEPESFEERLSERLSSDGLNLPFQYAVLESGFPSELHSSKFEVKDQEVYRTALFVNDIFSPRSDLLVVFPDKTNYYIQSLWGVVLLSVLFTGIIVFVFSRTIKTIQNQKRLSEIKNDFINNMTHEFKTPIATIGLAIDSIEAGSILTDPNKVKHFTKIIREENARMNRQVESVLQISQMEREELQLNTESVDIHEVLIKAIDQMSLQLSAREGRVHQEWTANNSRVLIDEELMAHVWINLLDNAIKYSPDSVELTLRTRDNGKNLVVEIEDQGQGMSREQQKQAFDKFYRVTTGNLHDVKGHGLGLAYAREIIEAHHGKIWVESELGKGSTFYIELPIENE